MAKLHVTFSKGRERGRERGGRERGGERGERGEREREREGERERGGREGEREGEEREREREREKERRKREREDSRHVVELHSFPQVMIVLSSSISASHVGHRHGTRPHGSRGRAGWGEGLVLGPFLLLLNVVVRYHPLQTVVATSFVPVRVARWSYDSECVASSEWKVLCQKG